MELEITEKKNNPLLKRTEVRFIAKHETEGTPNRKLIRSELAESLNTKPQNIIIDSITSSFGSFISKGYAKAYTSQKHVHNVERSFQLKRNKVEAPPKKKEEKEPEEKKASSEPTEEKPEETSESEEGK